MCTRCDCWRPSCDCHTPTRELSTRRKQISRLGGLTNAVLEVRRVLDEGPDDGGALPIEDV